MVRGSSRLYSSRGRALNKFVNDLTVRATLKQSKRSATRRKDKVGAVGFKSRQVERLRKMKNEIQERGYYLTELI